MQNSRYLYIRRSLETAFLKASEQFPVLLVTGARQVGKTTFLKEMGAPERTYVTLDDPLILNLAKDDPPLFLQRFPPPILIDEIQYAPELLRYIKMHVDADRAPGRFWLTGSQQFHLMKGVTESLAGRIGTVHLLGLSRREILGQGPDERPFLPVPDEIRRRIATGGQLGLRDLYRMIWRGSYPALALNDNMDRDLFYSSYVQTYLQRDVRDLARVGDEMSFLRFLRATAARTGQLLNLSELAKDADIATNTAKSWLSILQASGIVHLLEPYHSNITKRLVKAPKLYMLDTGLCAYLTEWSSPETLEAGAMSGAILETWILSELLKTYWHTGKTAPFYYYRDKDQKEIDLLIIQDDTVYPVEIKKTASPSKADVRNFQTLERLKVKTGPGGVICLASVGLPLTPNASSIPISAL